MKIKNKKINVKMLIGISIITLVFLLSFYWLKNRPTAHKKLPQKTESVVTVKLLQQQNYQMKISSIGQVYAKKQIDIKSQLAGKVIAVHKNFFIGGIVKKEEVVVQIEKKDYEIKRIQEQAKLSKAKLDWQQELGRQKIARQEYKLLEKELKGSQKKLVLRRPQLASFRASLKSAQAAYNLSQLNLQRTSIKAPYDLIIQKIFTNIGATVRTYDSIATINGTDKYLLKSNITQKQRNQLDHKKREVMFSHLDRENQSKPYEATLISVAPQLDSKSKLVQIISEINDPLNLKQQHKNAHRVFIDSLMRVNVKGKILQNVYIIDSQHISNDGTIQTVDKKNILKIIKVQVLDLDKNKTIISSQNIPLGTFMVTSHISIPVEGMKLSIKKDKK